MIDRQTDKLLFRKTRSFQSREWEEQPTTTSTTKTQTKDFYFLLSFSSTIDIEPLPFLYKHELLKSPLVFLFLFKDSTSNDLPNNANPLPTMNETSDVDIKFKRLYSKTNNPPAITVEEFLDALSFSSCHRSCRMIFLLQFQMAQPAHYPSLKEIIQKFQFQDATDVKLFIAFICWYHHCNNFIIVHEGNVRKTDSLE